MAGASGRERSGAYRVFIQKPIGNKLLGRTLGRWKDNIKITIKEIRWDNVNWINLAHSRDTWWTTWY
jgi:hypothetical protein